MFFVNNNSYWNNKPCQTNGMLLLIHSCRMLPPGRSIHTAMPGQRKVEGSPCLAGAAQAPPGFASVLFVLGPTLKGFFGINYIFFFVF